jgi:hypothetical protein
VIFRDRCRKTMSGLSGQIPDSCKALKMLLLVYGVALEQVTSL